MVAALTRIRKKLEDNNCQAFISTNITSRRYLTNFTGSAGLVWIDKFNNLLVTDFRYIEQANQQSPDWKIIEQKQGQTLFDVIDILAKKYEVEKIAFESEYITVNEFNQLQKSISVNLMATKDWVLEGRMIKNPVEIERITRAAELTDKALAQVIPMIKWVLWRRR